MKQTFKAAMALALTALGITVLTSAQAQDTQTIVAQTRPKVSVIVPIYNVEKWLRECADSLVNQTLDGVETIFVDDGSPDNSGLIADEYQRKYPDKVKVIHKKNGGVQRARNDGIKKATGEYITFADSDDYLDINAYKTAYNAAKKDNVDILQFGHRPFTEGNDNHEKATDFSDSNVINLQEFWSRTYANYVWDKLYKAELIQTDNIEFMPDIKPADDTCFAYMAIGRAKTFKIIPGRFYNYRIRPGSISNMSLEKIFLNSYKMFGYIWNDWKTHNCLIGKEHLLLESSIRWCTWYYDYGIKYAKELINSFGDDMANTPAVQKCSKYIQDYIHHLKYAASSAEHPIQDGIYTITSAINPFKAVDVNGSSNKSKANIQLYDKNYSKAQKFTIKYHECGYYTIQSLCSNKFIDVAGANSNMGANIWQYEGNNSDAQKWYIVPCGDGYYKLISKCNLLVMDVAGAKTKNGTNIQCWEDNGTNAQKFKLERIQ